MRSVIASCEGKPNMPSEKGSAKGESDLVNTQLIDGRDRKRGLLSDSLCSGGRGFIKLPISPLFAECCTQYKTTFLFTFMKSIHVFVGNRESDNLVSPKGLVPCPHSSLLNSFYLSSSPLLFFHTYVTERKMSAPEAL